MNNKIIFGGGGIIVGLIVASVIGGGLFTGDTDGRFGMMHNGGKDTDNSQIMGNIDQHFIEQMIPHHKSAVAMAELALQKATRPEIKTLAESIINDQNKEIKDMTAWYGVWFKKDVPKGTAGTMEGGMMSGGGMHGGTDDMQSLEKATDFDKAFLEAMIPHHQSAIMMAEMLQSGTTRPEMQTLAKNIVTSQAKEIEDMKGWYTEWYE